MKQVFSTYLLFFVLNASGVSLNPYLSKNVPLKYSGRITINPANAFPKKSLFICYYTDEGVDASKAIWVPVVIDSVGNFKVEIPNLNKPMKVFINIVDNHKPVMAKNFFSEPGDDIQMDINLKQTSGYPISTIFFHGKGSNKYNLVESLRMYDLINGANVQLKNKFMGEDWLFIKDSVNLNSKINAMTTVFRSLKLRKAEKIRSAKINENIKVLIDREYSNYNMSWGSFVHMYYNKYPALRHQVARMYFLHNNEFEEYVGPDSLIRFCDFYLYQLSLKLANEMIMKSRADKVSLPEYYSQIKKSYSGRIRERLILYCLLQKQSERLFEQWKMSTKDSLLKDAIGLLKDPHNISMILERMARDKNTHDKKVIDAQFTDLTGKIFHLRSLRGKVVLVDIWFNGCSYCSLIHSSFKKDVYPDFKDNKDFVVLSVNVDHKKERWIAGMVDEKYTSQNNINVTTGSGFKHSFLNFYGIIGAPWMMLISEDGTIVYQPNNINPEKMKEQIEMTLGKLKNKKKNSK